MRRGTSATDATPADAADDTSREAELFVKWVSAHRRRAALDGAWKIEVSERVVNGTATRFITTWHDRNIKPQTTPLRRGRQQGGDVPVRSEEPVASSIRPQRLSARKRRSALRSATHHKKVRLRALRSHLLAVRFLVRLSRLTVAARAFRDAPSPGKRRLSSSQ